MPGVDQMAVVAEGDVSLADRQLAVEHVGADVPSTLRTSACAQTAPNRPVEAPTTATGLPRRALSGNGREAQSSAFFSTPGIDPLNSGVEMSTPSASAIASRRRATGSGAGSTSRSAS